MVCYSLVIQQSHSTPWNSYHHVQISLQNFLLCPCLQTPFIYQDLPCEETNYKLCGISVHLLAWN